MQGFRDALHSIACRGLPSRVFRQGGSKSESGGGGEEEGWKNDLAPEAWRNCGHQGKGDENEAARDARCAVREGDAGIGGVHDQQKWRAGLHVQAQKALGRVRRIRTVRNSADPQDLRGEGPASSSAEDQQFFTKTSELLEERFGATLVRTTSAASDFKFANGRVVSAALAHGIVSITACDAELQKLAQREFEELEARLLAEDVRVLALRPEKQGNEALGELVSVFGVVFGEPCRWGKNPVENNARAWVCEFEPEGAFMECSDFYVFATSKSKRVFMVRAVFDGTTPELIEDDSDNPEEDAAQAKYDQMRRMLERLVGRHFKDTGSNEYDKQCRMNIGDHFYILLCKTKTSEKVMLDFCSRDMGALNDQEAAERNSDDLFGSANRGLQGLGGF